ncbi:MAG: ClpX C4-type zinc finger [Deltaproteobacteria bacterium]|nr:ClpX C4-type zinc finger [Deltaproteobacteria bacterium]
MNVKQLTKRWRSLFSKDASWGATCSFCGRPRAETKRLVEGPGAYICDGCALLATGVLALHDEPCDVGFRALDAIVSALPQDAPYPRFEPLLEAMMVISGTAESSAVQIYQHAEWRGHLDLALRALLVIPPQARSPQAWHDIAALSIDLERFDLAREAIEDVRARSDGDVYGDCHRAMLAAHAGNLMDEQELADLVARARAHANVAVAREALEALARHRARRGDVQGALAAIEDALTGRARASSVLLLRGDLLADSDHEAAVTAWREALALVHPESVFARRSRDRLAKEPAHR